MTLVDKRTSEDCKMVTPEAKKRKTDVENQKETSNAEDEQKEDVEGCSRVLAQFVSESGEAVGTPLDVTLDLTTSELQQLCDEINDEQEEPVPYKFLVREKEVTNTLRKALEGEKISTEEVLNIVFIPQAVFRVRAVTRCTSSLAGHSQPVLIASFSPDGQYLASGSGDTTVRFWDLNTETPHYTCKGHKNWVLCTAWAPDGKKLASSCKDARIMLWDPNTGTQVGRTMTGHKQWITSLAWQPLHKDPECRHLASSGKDGDIRIWDTILGSCLKILSGHQKNVTCVKWGGKGLLYSSSHDRTVCVWRADDGVLCRTLKGHAHIINFLALSTDYVLRTGAFEPAEAKIGYTVTSLTTEELKEKAMKRYQSVVGNREELLVSASDDFTLYLWMPESSNKPVARMTGHKQAVNDVMFSPDGRLIASASFDKSIKIWESRTGKFVKTLYGHVGRVYKISWSADSRLLVSGSSDSTLKVYNLDKEKSYLSELPGHADEVYTVDWSPDGQRVVSGGKDKLLRLWRR